MADRIYFYPGWIRVWHSVNGLICLGLIVTGISMQYSNSHSFMVSFMNAVKLHNICGILLSFNYLLFFIGNIISKNITHYKIKFDVGFDLLIAQFKHYAHGIFKDHEEPYPINEERKFNPLQKVVYAFVMYICVPCVIISGLGMMYPDILLHHLFGLGGFMLTSIFHIIMGFMISIFMIIHFYLCFLNGSLKSIINGWHDIDKENK